MNGDERLRSSVRKSINTHSSSVDLLRGRTRRWLSFPPGLGRAIQALECRLLAIPLLSATVGINGTPPVDRYSANAVESTAAIPLAPAPNARCEGARSEICELWDCGLPYEHPPLRCSNCFTAMSNVSSYRRPLAVYVVWHNPAEGPSEANTIAHQLYAHLNHDDKNPFSRSLGVPVYFRNQPAISRLSSTPLGIPLNNDPDAAQYTAVVVLIDEQMLLDRNSWGPQVASLFGTSGQHRCFLVGLSDFASKLHPTLAQRQFIRVPAGNRITFIANRVTHELCRLLYERNSLDDDVQTLNCPSVGVFLSHAKRDGLPITEGIRDYISKHLSLRSFFDARDILPSALWEEVLTKNARNAALLAIQTDAYASREWCQNEILEAKQARVPVVVVNAVTSHEPRSFPYLGNVPTVRWNPQNEDWHEELLGKLFLEVLHGKFFPLRVEALCQLHGLPRVEIKLPYAPELLTALPFPVGSTIVYPDPPLAGRELELLTTLNRGFRFATPSTLTNLS